MYKHLLVGTDGSSTATRAVEAAARIAHAHNATLTIVHAFDPRQPSPVLDPGVEREFPWLRFTGARADAVVRAAVDRAHAAACGGLEVHGRVEPGSAAGVLTAVAEEVRPDAVVVGNADVRRLRLRRSIGHALSLRVSADVVIVDTVGRPDAREDRSSAA